MVTGFVLFVVIVLVIIFGLLMSVVVRFIWIVFGRLLQGDLFSSHNHFEYSGSC